MIPNILLISGSVRSGSVNGAVIATAAGLMGAPPQGTARPATATIYAELGELPHFNPDRDYEPLPDPVARLRGAIAASSALLFSTPEYAGAMPGALKNLLEWTVGGIETTGKPAGWINPSTNPFRAGKTYESLGTVLRYTGADLVDDACLDAPVPRASIDENGIITDPAARAAILRALGALLDAAESRSR